MSSIQYPDQCHILNLTQSDNLIDLRYEYKTNEFINKPKYFSNLSKKIKIYFFGILACLNVLWMSITDFFKLYYHIFLIVLIFLILIIILIVIIVDIIV
jgi:hypothetical protein